MFRPTEIIKAPIVVSNIPKRGDNDSEGNNYWEANRREIIRVISPEAPNKTFAQFGVYKGQSVPWLKEQADKLYLFDSFEGLPEDWSEKMAKGFFKTNVPEFNDENIHVIKGLIENTIKDFRHVKFGLIHIDTDVYSTAKTILDNIRTFSGQIIIFDELYNIQEAQEHEYKALMEWDKPYEIIGRSLYSQVAIRML